ncbi:MAG TPA: MBL fold metallo-hydrolase [Alphaproteobacteria bacterium]|nr:MBL fold metallo-hydrolase [Alphaproteobacteria bacterium]
MTATHTSSETSIDEIAEGIYRINTPVDIPGGGFSFNQYLILDEAPLLFHTGLRRLFPQVSAAVARVMPVERLRYIGLSHFEADECGALNQFLAAAPQAEPLCGGLAARISVNDFADRPARTLEDGEALSLGKRRLRWLDTPHLPHAWECGFLSEETTATLLCGDLFTQPGKRTPPLTEGDILGPSEAFRGRLDYYAHAANTRTLLERLAATRPRTLACMHGSAWRGDGAALLRALADRIETSGVGVARM